MTEYVYKQRTGTRARRRLVLFLGALAVLVLTGTQARALEANTAPALPETDAAALIATESWPFPDGENDSCLSLLKTARYEAAPSAVDRGPAQARQAAALGLVFGVRFALGPRESAGHKRRPAVSLNVWQPRDESGVQAMAVAEYRRCRNEEALRALSDWRWSR